MIDPYSRFRRRLRYRSSLLDTGIDLLDEIYKPALFGANLITLEKYAGNTALMLTIAESALNRHGLEVVYVDIRNDLKKNRLTNLERMIVLQARDSSDILEVCAGLRDYKVVFVLDGVEFLKDEWKLQEGVENLMVRMRKLNPRSTILCTTAKTFDYNRWDTFVVGVTGKYRTNQEGEKIGHFLDLRSDEKFGKVYIEYFGGRVSKGFDVAYRLLKEHKLAKTSIYSADGITERGFWNFVQAYDESLVNNGL